MNNGSQGLLVAAVMAFGCSGQIPEQTQSIGQAEGARVAAERLAGVSAAGMDCGAFDQYTASLATLTVDCLGTIAPDSFRVSEEGALQRNFASCSVDATRLSAIDQLLSLQARERQLPRVKACFAGRYADFLRDFAESGIAQCPSWRGKETLNPITFSVIDEVRQLQPLPEAEPPHSAVLTNAARASELLEEKNRYRVEGGSVDDAVRCAGGFAGFVIGTDKARPGEVVTDPTAWLLDTTYSSATADPYLRPGYYHTMSYYGPLPGAIFGNVNRFRPCPTCGPEICSYYAGSHIKTYLQLDCVDESDWATCVSYCGPKLP